MIYLLYLKGYNIYCDLFCLISKLYFSTQFLKEANTTGVKYFFHSANNKRELKCHSYQTGKKNLSGVMYKWTFICLVSVV